MFRRKPRCQNLSPSMHPGYRGRQCERELEHGGLCWIKIGMYRHVWRQRYYEKLGQALTK